MNPMPAAKVILAVAGIAVFFIGVRVQVTEVRWMGVALVVAAWLLRFVPRPRAPE